MANIYKFSDRMVDAGERLADVADAVQGKGSRNGRGIGARWLILPAVGAGLYALVANGSFKRQAKSVANQAKTRASDLPEELVGLVQQTTRQTSTSRKKTGQTSSSRKKTSASRSGSQPRRKSTSAAR